MEIARQAANASAPLGALEFDNPTQALVYDLTQPCVVDSGCFVEIIVGEIRRQRSARILELGCGTGLQALPILDRLHEIQYLGIDRSSAMIAIFEQKLDGLQKRRADAVLRAGFDLRMRGVVETLAPLHGGAVLLSQFLQYLPLEPTLETLARSEMLTCCVDLAGRGGRVFIIEDVMGEDDAGHAQLSSEWDRAVLARYRENLDRLRGSLGGIAPRYFDAIGKLIERPALMPAMRERRRKTRGESIMPLSKWRQLLGGLERPFTLVQHRELSNFYLTVIEC